MNKDRKLIIKKNIVTTIGKKGYSIVKNKIEEKIIKEIRKDLCVQPFINNDYGGVSNPFNIYLEGETKLYLPKHYGLKKFGKPDIVKISKGISINVTFSGKLRNKQIPVVKKFLNSCIDGCFTDKTFGGIISVGCGFGKTIMALHILCQLGRKTIIIVHKEFLMNQWVDRINEFIPNAKIGKIQAKTIDVEGKDIVIAMLQSLSMKKYDDSLFLDFGFVIVDECHHIAAEIFSKALPKVNSYYSLGLSATPTRIDGLSKVFNLYLGPIIYKAKVAEDKPVIVNIIKYYDINPEYNKEELTSLGKLCVARMINNISQNVNRNNLILYLALDLVKKGKQVIILSDRRDQLSYLYGKINPHTSVGYYIGGMKQRDLDESEKSNIILGTFPMSSEGLDIPSLDAAIFATPKSSIEQSIGRITRKVHKDLPIAYDIVDCFSIFENQLKKREKVYKKLKYIIKTGILSIDKDISDGQIQYFIDNCLHEEKTINNNVCLIED